MPLYPGTANSFTLLSSQPNALYHGDQKLVFSAEAITAGQASDRIALGGAVDNNPGTVSVEGFFSADPGAFELDLETADTDADAFFQQEGLGITARNATTFAFRGEFVNVTALFARVRLKSTTNAANLTVRITRR